MSIKYRIKDTKISTPDCSLYRDMPLWKQIANIGVSRSVGYYLQEQGKYVIPNVRWGDERTYNRQLFDFAPAFAGIPKTALFLSEHMVAAGHKKINIILNPDLMLCYPN